MLIVDGLDEEFNDERRTAALNRIVLIADKQKQPRVLFTSRPFGTILVKDAHVLRLKEFARDEHIQRCTENCERILAGLEERGADATRVRNFLNALTEDRQRKDLARRPGHLVGMYVQFCDTGTTSLFEDDLMDWIAQERFKITGRIEPPLHPHEPTDKRQILEEICFHLLFCRETGVLLREDMLALIRAAKKETQFAHVAQTDILNDLVRNSGFLREVRMEGIDAYEVENALWLQFFTASYLAHQVRNRNEMLISWVFREAEWICPICPGSVRSTFYSYVRSAVFLRPDEAKAELLVLLTGLVRTLSYETYLLGLFRRQSLHRSTYALSSWTSNEAVSYLLIAVFT